MKKSIFIFISLLFVSNSCEVFDQGFELAKEFKLSYDETIHSTDQMLSLRFDTVMSDSRCPIGLTCFWEGECSIQIYFENAIESCLGHELILSTHPKFTTDTIINGYLIELIKVEPYPAGSPEISLKKYDAYLKISKTEEPK